MDPPIYGNPQTISGPILGTQNLNAAPNHQAPAGSDEKKSQYAQDLQVVNKRIIKQCSPTIILIHE